MTAITFKPSASSERFNDIWCAFVNVYLWKQLKRFRVSMRDVFRKKIYLVFL